MPKTSPEKLAAALRANLKRRKRPKGPEDGRAPKRAQDAATARLPEPPPDPAAKPAKKPPENRG